MKILFSVVFLLLAYHCSCLTVILRALDTLARPEVNAGVHELGFKVLSSSRTLLVFLDSDTLMFSVGLFVISISISI